MSVYTTDALKIALDYAEKGWRVFPVHSYFDGICTCGNPDCEHGGKHPATRHGFQDGTTDTELIRVWDKHFRGLCNWAVATGPESGIWSLDDDDGGEAIARLEKEFGALPITPRFRSGGGGEQRFFRWSDDGVGVKSLSRPIPGIDTRGTGGYSILPPSRHKSGRRSEWIVGPPTPLAYAPDWLLDLVRQESRPKPTPNSSALVFDVLPDTEDLANASGVGEGTRNEKLCQLIGVHLARGQSGDEIEPLALAWAEKCDPPYPESEVCRTLKKLAVKHQRLQEEDNEGKPAVASTARTNEVTASAPTEIVRSFVDDPDTLPPPLVVDELPELQPAALHGLAGEIVKVVTPETEADPAAILFQLLAAVGNMVGRGPHFRVGPGRHHANLFVLVVGDTASAKGQSLEIVSSLMRRAAPQWHEHCLCHGLSSGEGLIESVQDDEDDGTAPVGTGFHIQPSKTDKRLLAVETEFAGPLKLMRREGNILSPLLRNAWDGKTLEVRNRKKNALRATDAHIGVIGHITPPEFGHELDGKPELANGFSNRFTFCYCFRRRLLPFGGDPTVLDPFVKPLADVLAQAKSIGECRRSAESDHLWEEVYPKLTESKPGCYGRAVERARPQVMRLAMIYALLDGSSVIELSHLRAGLALWEYADQSARRVFNVESDNKKEEAQQPLGLRLLDAIKATPGLSRTGLHDVLGRNRKADEIASALDWLREQGLTHTAKTTTGGRPSECWFPGAAPDAVDDPEPIILDEGTNERTKSEAQPESTGFVRSSAPGSIAELIRAVTELPGRFVWTNGSVVIDAESVPTELAEACQEFQAGLASVVPQPTTPSKPPCDHPDAKSVVDAVYSTGGKITKDDQGRCTLKLCKPDPDLERAFDRHHDAIADELMTEAEFEAAIRAI